MRFARWVFWIAGVYGVVVLTPMYFAEQKIAADFPPAITHPEHFYGFVGVALAWQLLFFLIGADPARLRPAMLPAVLEKLSYSAATIVLYLQGRLHGLVFAVSQVDLLFVVLFSLAYLQTGRRPS